MKIKKTLTYYLLPIIFFLACSPSPIVVQSIYPGDEKMWQRIFAVESDIVFEETPRAAILPHHMIVGDELSQFYQSLAAKIRPEVIVILSPNHFQSGDALVQTCETCLYETIDGPLPLADELIDQIIATDLAEANDHAFVQEHGFHAHTPYIKRFLPEAKILPLMLKWESDLATTTALADWLSANLPQNNFVIASVDFSHYITAQAADFHDVASYATIKNFDLANVFDLEVDSPASLATVLQFAENIGAQNAQRFKHTNNQDFRPAEFLTETTSHQFFAFFDGPLQAEKSLTITSFGNIDPALGGGLGFFDSWRYVLGAPTPNETINPYLRDIRGSEDRFLSGSDFLVFDLPNDTCRPAVQNGLTINFCKLTAPNPELLNDQNGDYLYLLYQFPPNTTAAQAQQIARQFATTGVDIFIGRGLAETLPVEEIDGKILAPSLGQFIVNEKEASGLILGIALTSEGNPTFQFPITVDQGYPKL